MSEKSPTVVIIGAGIAGLCAGVYARQNGYRALIFEQHTLPGGLCTAWKRKDYTIDFCIHWLVGSRPGGNLHELWREVGLVQGREIVDLDEFSLLETSTGETVVFYRDLARTEEYLLELAPGDAPLLRRLFADVRSMTGRDLPSDLPPREIMGRREGLRSLPALLPLLRPIRRWSKLSTAELGAMFTHPALREAFTVAWHPEMSAITLLMTLAWLADRNAGYPIGGSMPLARAIERRFLDLGGEIEYGARVAEIVVERDRAVGVAFDDDREVRADWVISAADGHATLFDLLHGRYMDETLHHYYRDFPRFPSLVFIGLGVARSFADQPRVVTGWSLPLDPPLSVAGVATERMGLRIFNFDPTLAPAGKTVLTVTLEGDYDHWTGLAAEDDRYEEEKAAVAAAVLDRLERRFPGLREQLEVVDVATPATIERYTGNWRGSYEGWLPTPENVTLDMRRTLPGLDGFVMAGQWVMPGGGLPSGVMSGRQALQIICKRDGRGFRAQT